jgi:hypothetical protein
MALGTDTPDTDTSNDTEVPSETEPVFAITDAALAKVTEIRSAEDDPESLCLWIEVTGANGVDSRTTCRSKPSPTSSPRPP